MTYKEFFDKYKGTNLYINVYPDVSVRAFLSYSGVISFTLPSREEMEIDLFSGNLDPNVEVNKTSKGFHLCETDTEGYSDWDIYTCAEESY